MSSYMAKTKHPFDEHYEMAIWQDDYFGSHEYGVRFLSEPLYYKASFYDMPTKECSNEEIRKAWREFYDTEDEREEQQYEAKRFTRTFLESLQQHKVKGGYSLKKHYEDRMRKES